MIDYTAVACLFDVFSASFGPDKHPTAPLSSRPQHYDDQLTTTSRSSAGRYPELSSGSVDCIASSVLVAVRPTSLCVCFRFVLDPPQLDSAPPGTGQRTCKQSCGLFRRSTSYHRIHRPSLGHTCFPASHRRHRTSTELRLQSRIYCGSFCVTLDSVRSRRGVHARDSPHAIARTR